MAVNRDKPDRWKEDILQSVDLYNEWFMKFAPTAFRETRIQTTKHVQHALQITNNLTDIRPDVVAQHPEILPMLRMCTCPPIARDRLIGLAGVSPTLVRSMELNSKLPTRMNSQMVQQDLAKIADIITRMVAPDIFVWRDAQQDASKANVHRAATVVADRLCGAVADPIIRNAQEQRQLSLIGSWLDGRGYTQIPCGEGIKFDQMPPGTYSFRMNVPVTLEGGAHSVNIPIDAVVMPNSFASTDMPLFIEAKSAGDYTNVNKRRKEEAVKMSQLRSTYGSQVRFILFLCGYFDSGYLGYEAAEGIDWVWEHRIDDLMLFGA